MSLAESLTFSCSHLLLAMHQRYQAIRRQLGWLAPFGCHMACQFVYQPQQKLAIFKERQ